VPLFTQWQPLLALGDLCEHTTPMGLRSISEHVSRVPVFRMRKLDCCHQLVLSSLESRIMCVLPLWLASLTFLNEADVR
jgi:hypothetical protein